MVAGMLPSGRAPAASTVPRLTAGKGGKRDNSIFPSNTDNSKISPANEPGTFTELAGQNV